MEKPIIRVYQRGDDFYYHNDLVSEGHLKYYGCDTYFLPTIMFVLKTIWQLEKGEDGQYKNIE